MRIIEYYANEQNIRTLRLKRWGFYQSNIISFIIKTIVMIQLPQLCDCVYKWNDIF